MTSIRRNGPFPLLVMAAGGLILAAEACSFDWEGYDPRLSATTSTGATGPGPGGGGTGGNGGAGGMVASATGTGGMGVGGMGGSTSSGTGGSGTGGMGGSGTGGMGGSGSAMSSSAMSSSSGSSSSSSSTGAGTGGMGGGGAGTGGAPPSDLHVKYKAGNTNTNDIQIQPHFRIVNDSQNNVPWTDLKVRYWFTGDGGMNFVYDCDFAQFNCIYTKGTFATTTGVKADMYLELSFLTGSGVLLAGSDSGEIQTRIHTQNFTTVNQSGDYSYDPTKTTYADWANVTLYNKGVLVWGVEP